MNININREVVVELTKEGINQLIFEWNKYAMPAHYADPNNYNKKIPYFLKRSKTKIQVPLWELMKIFGSKTYMGGPQLIVDNNITLTEIV